MTVSLCLSAMWVNWTISHGLETWQTQGRGAEGSAPGLQRQLSCFIQSEATLVSLSHSLQGH